MKIKKAVIPVAGLGTRFLPATKSIPKEMIPIVDTPMIQYIVEEAVRSGIDEIVLVTARHKEAIENHFDYNAELDAHLKSKAKEELLQISRKTAELCKIISIRQNHPLGLGHAVGVAEPVIGREPFAVLLGDDLIDSKTPCTRQLLDVFEKERKSVVGVMEVPAPDVTKYGIVGGPAIREKLWKVDTVIEKPAQNAAPSRLAIPGRYVLVPEVFDHLRSVKPGAGGEIQLTDGLTRLAADQGLLAFQFDGDRYDTGDKIGYIDATLTFALRRPELKDAVKKLLEKHHEK